MVINASVCFHPVKKKGTFKRPRLLNISANTNQVFQKASHYCCAATDNSK